MTILRTWASYFQVWDHNIIRTYASIIMWNILHIFLPYFLHRPIIRHCFRDIFHTNGNSADLPSTNMAASSVCFYASLGAYQTQIANILVQDEWAWTVGIFSSLSLNDTSGGGPGSKSEAAAGSPSVKLAVHDRFGWIYGWVWLHDNAF